MGQEYKRFETIGVGIDDRNRRHEIVSRAERHAVDRIRLHNRDGGCVEIQKRKAVDSARREDEIH